MNKVIVKENDTAITVYGKIINALRKARMVQDFILDCYRINTREDIINVGHKYLEISLEN